jgi:hypothetical protein
MQDASLSLEAKQDALLSLEAKRDALLTFVFGISYRHGASHLGL